MTGATASERALYLDLAARLRGGQTVAVATLVRAWGSTPREVGAKMLVDAEGGLSGTIGGGCGEAEVWQEAVELLARGGEARLVHVDLTDELASDSGKVCGGRFDVLVERLDPDQPAARTLVEALERASRSSAEAVLITGLGPTGPPAWRRGSGLAPLGEAAGPGLGVRWAWLEPGGLLGGGSPEEEARLAEAARAVLRADRPRVASLTLEGGAVDVFLDPLASPMELVIAGAGHIARPLCRMGALCGYAVTVIDDRPEYAVAGLFPEATAVLCRPFDEAFTALRPTARTHVVLVTRGHKHDEACLRRLIGQELAYLGMIGSRRRTRAVFTELLAEGVDPGWLSRVHAPIGLDIGAQTPEEIAVAILGEMIRVRRGGQAAGLSLQQRVPPAGSPRPPAPTGPGS